MFNLNDYETVEERLTKWWGEHKNGKIQTELIEASANRFIVFAKLFRDEADSQAYATGLAEETVSSRGVNQTSALENCETSAIGRALANAGYAAKGKRASREEMSKVAKGKPDSVQIENPANPWTIVEKPAPTQMPLDQIAAELQAEEIPQCKHGAMILKEGNKNNRAFHGYVCRIGNMGSSTDACPPIWYDLMPSGKWAKAKPKAAK